jgi:hypothetical protein
MYQVHESENVRENKTLQEAEKIYKTKYPKGANYAKLKSNLRTTITVYAFGICFLSRCQIRFNKLSREK